MRKLRKGSFSRAKEIKDDLMSGETTKQRKLQHKKRRPHFHRQREKVLRGNDDPLAAVFSWGVSHHQRELSVIPQPKMLLADDFKAYSKLKVENHAFNRTLLPGHYKVKEYCPLVFRGLRERFDISEDDYTDSLSLHHIEPLITQDEIEKMEEANADGRMPGKLRKRDILRSYCGRFIVSLISTEDVEQLHNVLPSYYAHVVEQKGETLLPNWLGLYRCGISNRSDRYLLVTKSITRRIEVLSEAFRLKGTKIEKIEKKQKKEKKEKEDDKDKKELREPEWLQSGIRLHLISSDAQRFRTYLKNDLQLLQRLKLMNYSLDVRLCPQSDDEKEENHDSGHDGGPNSGDNRDSESDEDEDFEEEALTFRFKLENGGTVFLSLNDILNHYDTKKKAQNAVKSATHGNDDDKKVNPERYSRQFTEFLSSAVFAQWTN